MTWHKGQSGNPNGRQKGSVNHRLRTVLETLDKLNFHPFEEKIRLAMRLKNRLQRNHFADVAEKTAYLGLYADVLKDLLQYTCPKLKQIDHVAHIAIIQKLQSLDSYSDAELAALLEEAREIARGDR